MTSVNEHQRQEVEQPISISHFFSVLRAYARAILLVAGSIALLAAILLVARYLFAPTIRVSTLPFRLTFQGAEDGKYPNGVKFSPAEITAGPILLRVYKQNELERFAKFEPFSRSLFVLEANRTLEQLNYEYQAKLSDPKLSPIDRERLQAEFAMKRDGISKSDYSLNFIRSSGTKNIPESTTKKVLHDVLDTWARTAAVERGVMKYDMPLLSPNVLRSSAFDDSELFISAHILLSRINQLLSNIDLLEEIPGSNLVQTRAEKISLFEIRLRLEDLLRFRLEPLIAAVANDSTRTRQFVAAQLAYDSRKLEAMQRRADAIRASIELYDAAEKPSPAGTPGLKTGATAPGTEIKAGETVMPQLSDSFLDRIMALTSSVADREYRQQVVERYRDASLDVAPVMAAVTYDQQLLRAVETSGRGASPESLASARGQIEEIREEARKSVLQLNELYGEISKNLNPSTQLFTYLGPVSERAERGVPLQKLALYGLLAVLLSVPIAIVGALIHNRVRDEDASERREAVVNSATAAKAVTPASTL
jgi:hypothetical protein